MPEPLLLLERDGDVATLTFRDPERRNAMSEAMGQAFAARMAELARDPSLRALVLAGAGEAFSAGGDLEMIQARADEAAGSAAGQRRVREQMRAFYGLFLSLRELPCPTVAAVHGAAIGAGLCVALACDVRLVGEQARLGLNFTALGLHPGMGATWTLPRLVGPERAAELLYSSRLFSGEEAVRMGLASRALPAEQVLPEAQELARRFAASSPQANRAVKRALARSPWASLEDQLAFEADEQATCFAGADVQEGLSAVRDKRRARFAGG